MVWRGLNGLRISLSLFVAVTNYFRCHSITIAGGSKKVTILIKPSITRQRFGLGLVQLQYGDRARNYAASSTSLWSYSGDAKDRIFRPIPGIVAEQSGASSINSLPMHVTKSLDDISVAYLKKIIDYGKNRMARRALEILREMQDNDIVLHELHYTQAIWACEQSEQYAPAMEILDEMHARNVPLSASTYEALISLAEKTSQFDAAERFLEEKVARGFTVSTFAFNAGMIAADRSGNYKMALKFLRKMEELHVEKDETTYTACMWACEKSGEGLIALDLMREMRAKNMDLSTSTYNAVAWACVRGGYFQDALEVIEEMQVEQKAGNPFVKLDATSYNAAIWACEQAGESSRAVQYLRLMKFAGLKRESISFDGAISALHKEDQWEQMVDILSWMEREGVPKTYITYQNVIDSLERKGKYELMNDVYLSSLRDGFFSPWVKNTRKLDLRGFTTGLAKIAMKTVLEALRDRSLPLFALNIAIADVPLGSEAQHNDRVRRRDEMLKRRKERLERKLREGREIAAAAAAAASGSLPPMKSYIHPPHQTKLERQEQMRLQYPIVEGPKRQYGIDRTRSPDREAQRRMASASSIDQQGYYQINFAPKHEAHPPSQRWNSTMPYRGSLQTPINIESQEQQSLRSLNSSPELEVIDHAIVDRASAERGIAESSVGIQSTQEDVEHEEEEEDDLYSFDVEELVRYLKSLYGGEQFRIDRVVGNGEESIVIPRETLAQHVVKRAW